MFFRFFSYLKFILKSSNQHGVHSPFVYKFITQGLYRKGSLNSNLEDYSFTENLSKKEKKVFIKIINYFKPEVIINNLSNKSITSHEINKILYFSNLKYNKINELSIQNPNSIIVLKNIHQNRTFEKNWNKIVELENATVTIDLFYFGLIFFRKEQEKEHFRIRV